MILVFLHFKKGGRVPVARYIPEPPKPKPEKISEKIKTQMDILAMDFDNGVEVSERVMYKVLKKLHFEAIEIEQKSTDLLKK